jgi:hypothetical protein
MKINKHLISVPAVIKKIQKIFVDKNQQNKLKNIFIDILSLIRPTNLDIVQTST